MRILTLALNLIFHLAAYDNFEDSKRYIQHFTSAFVLLEEVF